MAKIDLDLINSDGRGRSVPKEMDRHMVKFVVGNRKEAIDQTPVYFKPKDGIIQTFFMPLEPG
jgi:hypothetical protein